MAQLSKSRSILANGAKSNRAKKVDKKTDASVNPIRTRGKKELSHIRISHIIIPNTFGGTTLRCQLLEKDLRILAN